MKTLSPTERKLLKARAHALKPVVAVSSQGLSPAVVREIETSLEAHELIKIRAGGENRGTRQAMLDEICSLTGAAPVQHIGKMLVIFRESQEEAAPPTKKPAARKEARRTKRSYQND